MNTCISSKVLSLLQQVIGSSLANFQVESESSAYGACRFTLAGKSICFRNTKKTPKKLGLFVTLWKRNQQGTIIPLGQEDMIDFVILSCVDGERKGIFIFPVEELQAQGVMSSSQYKGKTAFRVYPLWDDPISRQAQKTQCWQKNYFINCTLEPINMSLLLKYLV